MKFIENISVGVATVFLFGVLCALVYGMFKTIYKLFIYLGVENVLVALIYTTLIIFGVIAVLVILYEIGDSVIGLLKRRKK